MLVPSSSLPLLCKFINSLSLVLLSLPTPPFCPLSLSLSSSSSLYPFLGLPVLHYRRHSLSLVLHWYYWFGVWIL